MYKWTKSERHGRPHDELERYHAHRRYELRPLGEPLDAETRTFECSIPMKADSAAGSLKLAGSAEGTNLTLLKGRSRDARENISWTKPLEDGWRPRSASARS